MNPPIFALETDLVVGAFLIGCAIGPLLVWIGMEITDWAQR